MSSNLSETSTFTSTVTVPDDGDALNVSSVNTPFGAIANRTQYLRDRVVSFYHPLTLREAGNWQMSATAVSQVAVIGISDGYLTPIPFNTGTLTQIQYVARAGAGHGGALPTTVAGVKIFRRSSVSFPASLMVVVADDSANATDYEANHTVTASGLSVDLSAGTHFVALRPENGGSAVTGYTIISILLTID